MKNVICNEVHIFETKIEVFVKGGINNEIFDEFKKFNINYMTFKIKSFTKIPIAETDELKKLSILSNIIDKYFEIDLVKYIEER